MFPHPTLAADWVIIMPVVLPLLGAALLLMLRGAPRLQAPIALLTVAAVLLCNVLLFSRILGQGTLAMTMGNWLPPFGITFAADLTGAGLAALSAAVTLPIILFAQQEQSGRRPDTHALILLLLAGVSGSFLTGDLFNLYVWFEVMLIASFGLLVLRGRTMELDAAVKYGILNLLATTLFLLALGLLYGQLGTLNMADIARLGGAVSGPAMTVTAALLLLAFGMKAAAFPVNAWLPASYHAPSPAVSALLAGLPTKVGAYAILRTFGMLLPDAAQQLQPVIATVAVATLVIAPLGAIAETNLRRALGFLVIGGIGAALGGVALASSAGLQGAVLYLAHSMLTMSALYLVAGLVEQTTGEADTRRMGGLYAAHSGVSAMFLLLILAAAGVPPLLGFWPKLLLLRAGLEAPAGAGIGTNVAGALLAAALLLNSLLTLIAGTRIWSHVFWRQGPVGALSEFPNPAVRPFDRRELAFGVTSAAILTAGMTGFSLLPDGLIGAAEQAATQLRDLAGYTAAVGLQVTP